MWQLLLGVLHHSELRASEYRHILRAYKGKTSVATEEIAKVTESKIFTNVIRQQANNFMHFMTLFRTWIGVAIIRISKRKKV